MSVLQVRGLTTRIPTVREGESAWVHAATDLDLDLDLGRVRALVGESGCGKSMLAATIIGLLPRGTRVTGSVRLDSDELLGGAGDGWRAVRGRRIGMVPQSPSTYLTPTRTVGSQLAETVRELGGARDPEALMERVSLDREALQAYPHELSGGMAQRVGVACAMAGDPEVVIADEPTSGLDPALARRTYELLRMCADDGAAVLLITHDLGGLLDTQVADDLTVMYAGRFVEQGEASQVLSMPEHAYTQALLNALPRNGMHPVPGTPPSLTDLHDGVRFEDRLVHL